MGEFFLISGLVSIGVSVATVFFIIPGIVLGIAWSLAVLLAVDKGKNALEAISLSNKCTYGSKMGMFGTCFVASFITWIPIFGPAVNVGVQASIYKQLAKNV